MEWHLGLLCLPSFGTVRLTYKVCWGRGAITNRAAFVLTREGLIQLTGAVGYDSRLAMTVEACELDAVPDAEVLQD